MNERRYHKFLPGDTIELALELRNVQMHLRRVSARFLHEERAEVGLAAEGEVVEGGVAEPGGGIEAVAKLALDVPARPLPGVYKLYHLRVDTFGERTYHYDADELDAELGFEIIEEPDVKPEIRITVGT